MSTNRRFRTPSDMTMLKEELNLKSCRKVKINGKVGNLYKEEVSRIQFFYFYINGKNPERDLADYIITINNNRVEMMITDSSTTIVLNNSSRNKWPMFLPIIAHAA